MQLLRRPAVLFVSSLCVLLCGCGAFAEIRDGGREPGRYRILVSNDDGIASPRLHALALSLSELGEVVVVAPDGNRSGASHSVQAYRISTVVSEKAVLGASRAIAVNGTPADAVNYGLFVIGKDRPFDIVVSGINKGHNAGLTAHVSGTVGAAMEAVYRGTPGVAVSSHEDATDHVLAANFTRRFVRELLTRGAPDGIGFNINVPVKPNDGSDMQVVVAPMGGLYYRTARYEKDAEATGEAFKQVSDTGPDGPAGCDLRAFCAGKIAVTPIRLDWTDREMLEKVRSWGLTVR